MSPFSPTDSLEEGRRVKKARAPAALDIHPSEPDQQLERNNLNPQSAIPPGFLSPSVQEYLELGKSIPGKSKKLFLMNHWVTLFKSKVHLFSKAPLQSHQTCQIMGRATDCNIEINPLE